MNRNHRMPNTPNSLNGHAGASHIQAADIIPGSANKKLMLAAQVRTLHESIISAVSGSLIIVAIVYLVLVGEVSQTNLIIWTALLTGTQCLRLGLYVLMRKRYESLETKQWLFLLRLLTFMSGLAWGSLPILNFPADPSHQLILPLVAAGFSGAALSKYAADRMSVILFCLPVLLLLVCRLLYEGGEINTSIGLMVSVYLVFVLIFAYRGDVSFRHTVDIQEKANLLNAALIQAQEVAKIGSFYWDIASDAVHWSDEHYRLWGLNPQSMTPTYALFKQGVHADDLAQMEDMLTQALAGGPAYDCVHRVVRPDGSERYIHGRGEVQFSNDGNPVRMIGTVQDITEQKIAEDELQRSEAMLGAIIQQMPAMVFMKRASDLKFELLNHAGEELLGVKQADVLGKSDYDFFTPEQADFFTSRDRIVLASGEPMEIREEPILAKDSETRYLHTRKIAIQNSAGVATHLLGISLDITELKRSEENLRIAAMAFETHEAIMITDADNRILRVNQAFERTTGYQADEVLGQTPTSLFTDQQDSKLFNLMWDEIIQANQWSGELWKKRKNGEIYPSSMTITAVKNALGHTVQYVAIFSDISDRKKAEEDLHHLAFYDVLTQLPNRRLLLDRLNVACAASARNRKYGALISLDLDNFKILNDTLGHAAGDYFLIEVANRIKSCLREIDTVARLGGDEFVILVENTATSIEKATQHVANLTDKIRMTLGTPFQIEHYTHHSSSSIGITLFYGHEQSVEDILRFSEMAMYQAKSSGRNLVQFFDPQMQHSVEQRVRLESDIRQALRDQHFMLHYQLQIDNAKQPIGAEALIRWLHPERGMVSPADFIPVAEETSLILDIGHWVLETACQQLESWSHDPLTQNLTLAINISAQQFKLPDFVERLANTIKKYHFEPSKLKLELTEGVALDDIDSVVSKMASIKHDLGIAISLDDFGTGYSSLSYLKQLPVDQIKIDQTFVRNILTDQDDATLVKTIIDMAHNFKLNVIAEGVESAQQFEYLRDNGCMAYQGYHFSKPIPIAQFEALVRSLAS